jgi:hypothetical protein
MEPSVCNKCGLTFASMHGVRCHQGRNCLGTTSPTPVTLKRRKQTAPEDEPEGKATIFPSFEDETQLEFMEQRLNFVYRAVMYLLSCEERNH